MADRASSLYASREQAVLGVQVPLVVLCTLGVALRLLARQVTKQKVWWDDVAVILSLGCVYIVMILSAFMLKHGLARHVVISGTEGAIFNLKCLKALEFLYAWVIGPAKLSVLLYFWRIFNVHHSFRPYFWVMFAIIALWLFTVGIIVPLAECTPFDAFWDRKLGHCISTGKFYTGVTVPNIITDVFLLIMPIPYIFGLELSMTRKIGISGIFGLGGIVIVMSALRLTATLRFETSRDVTWDFIPVYVYSILESHCAVICACLPSIPPLIRMAWGRFIPGRTDLETVAGEPSRLDGSFTKLPDVHMGMTTVARDFWETYELRGVRRGEN